MFDKTLPKTSSQKRIALLGIYHESNTFIQKMTTWDDFRNSHLLFGEDIINEYKDAHHEIGGMLEVLKDNNAEVVPILFAEATPGGTISGEAYDHLLSQLKHLLTKALPVDGCLVVPHGAAVSEGHPDMDGHWLSAVREILTDEIPIIGTLDPHANISRLMAESTNGLIAYKTNPHIDQRETGKASAQLLIDILEKKVFPVQVLCQTPVAISIEQQNTSEEPCKSLYKFAEEISREKSVLSVSIMLGFPYADVQEMGTSFLSITNNLPELARSCGDRLRSFLTDSKEKYVGIKNDIKSILPALHSSPKPILLLDMGDNVGGGSPGDSTYLLRHLENATALKSFICIYDPAAVKHASQYTNGDSFKIAFGDAFGSSEASPFVSEVTLVKPIDGKFQETMIRHGGQLNYDMGPSVILSTAAGNLVMLTSLRVPPFSLSQLTTFGIYVKDFDVVIAKGVNAPIAAYGPECKTIIKAHTPGVTQADMTAFNYRHRRKPLFPFEVDQ